MAARFEQSPHGQPPGGDRHRSLALAYADGGRYVKVVPESTMVPRYCDDEPGAAAPSTRNCSTATTYDAAPGDVRTHCGSAAPP